MLIREYQENDLTAMTGLWNTIVAEGDSFPQEDPLTPEEARKFFASQTASVCAFGEDGGPLGLYILHPNNVGRCAHIANASYAVAPGARGQGIGRTLVVHSLQTAKESGFLGLQYNAVVTTNETAVHLYEKLGFQRLARIENGFRADDGYRDTYIFFKTWPQHQS